MFLTDTNPQSLDQAMREMLAQSLNHIFDTIRNSIELDAEQCTQALIIIRTNKVSPKVFARYYDLVFAVNAEDFVLAQQLIDEIFNILNEPAQFEIIPYTHEILGDDFERFPRLVFTSYSSTNPMDSPDQKLYEEHKEKLEQAKKIIRTIDADIYHEIETLLLQVIISVHNKKFTSTKPYAGASSFMTWGAIFINARLYVTVNQIVEFFVHELTHCILLGYSCVKPLVLNPISENYMSPLRSDPRPMDGIFHATLVCARIALFMKKWVAYGATDDNHADWLDELHNSYFMKFYDGADIIKKEGQLSEKGTLLLNEAESSLSKYA